MTIHGPQLTPAIKELQRNIEALTNQQFINVFQDCSLIKLPLQSVSRFYTANKRLYCETTTGAYLVHSHLHTLMDQLPPHQFLRISSSEIVRIACVKNFTLTKWGSFQVNLTTGTTTYASRRYTQQIRKAAQLWKDFGTPFWLAPSEASLSAT